jgi:hypothetical protein
LINSAPEGNEERIFFYSFTILMHKLKCERKKEVLLRLSPQHQALCDE